MQKIPASELKGVSETLLIPLHYRVENSRNQANSFNDRIAEQFHDAIEYDWRKFSNDSLLSRIMPTRTAIFDAQVKAFLEKYPNGLVVNLGAGLDTRFYRLDNGTVEWVELDLPNVITLRQKLPEPGNERHRLIAASVLEEDWIPEIARSAKNRVLFVAEGLFPYFTEEEHKRIFTRLAESFPEQEMLFQTFAPSIVQGLVQYSDLPKMSTNVEVRWGLDDSTQVAALCPKVEFLREFPLLEGLYDRLPDPIRQKLSPEVAKKAGKIVHVRFRK
jgi:O-methyltransferase involved in polyketide biosynthesis